MAIFSARSTWITTATLISNAVVALDCDGTYSGLTRVLCPGPFDHITAARLEHGAHSNNFNSLSGELLKCTGVSLLHSLAGLLSRSSPNSIHYYFWLLPILYWICKTLRTMVAIYGSTLINAIGFYCNRLMPSPTRLYHNLFEDPRSSGE